MRQLLTLPLLHPSSPPSPPLLPPPQVENRPSSSELTMGFRKGGGKKRAAPSPPVRAPSPTDSPSPPFPSLPRQLRPFQQDKHLFRDPLFSLAFLPSCRCSFTFPSNGGGGKNGHSPPKPARGRTAAAIIVLTTFRTAAAKWGFRLFFLGVGGWVWTPPQRRRVEMLHRPRFSHRFGRETDGRHLLLPLLSRLELPPGGRGGEGREEKWRLKRKRRRRQRRVTTTTMRAQKAVTSNGVAGRVKRERKERQRTKHPRKN